MMRHASMQVNHNQLKELQQVTKPQAHTHMQTDTHFFLQRRHEQECTADLLIVDKQLKTPNQGQPTP